MIAVETPANRMLRWLSAAVVMSVFHCGAVAWALRPAPTDEWESQAGGAFIVELSDTTASPAEESPVSTVGETSEERQHVAASAPRIAAVAEPIPDEQPTVPETERMAPQDALARRVDHKPPDEAKTLEAVPAAIARDAPEAARVDTSIAAAPTRIANATDRADRPRGRQAGLSDLDRATIENWHRDISIHMRRHTHYPAKAAQSHQHGVVTVAVAVDRNGRVIRANIAGSSSFPSLDAAALEIIGRASPMPRPPAAIAGEAVEFVVPVGFRARKERRSTLKTPQRH